MKLINTREAAGHVLCHDLTQIIPGKYKGAAFKKGHVVMPEDIPVLLSIGKEHLYVWENDEKMLHEDDAARILYEICAGDHMHPSEVREGKIELISDCDGVLKVDRRRLRAVNLLGEMMIASRHSDTVVHAGDRIAGTRVIPLVIEKEKMERAKKVSAGAPVFRVLPFLRKKAAILTTGSEIFHGRIRDRFTPVIEAKLRDFNVQVVFREVFEDDPAALTDGCLRAIKAGAEMVFCTGGMSVDPDDRTPLAIRNTGARVVTYGAPVLPGAMFMLAYYENGTSIPISGLPGCAMYAKQTIFDLVLPRLVAGDEITEEELAGLGEGGLCLQCPTCVFPNCGFGKGR